MIKDMIFNIKTPQEFEEVALYIFQFQYQNNKIYQDFCNSLYRIPNTIKKAADIPFLPIQAFRIHQVITGQQPVDTVFASSGTTNTLQSTHYITDISIYQESYRKAFEYFYGPAKQYIILALLPTYIDRKESSLIYMVHDLIALSGTTHSGFHLDDLETLKKKLEFLDAAGEPILLIGVSFALLNLAEKYPLQLKNTIVMETGGMKGQRKEMIREELHRIIYDGLGVKEIHSEYGMTELLSQAYSQGDGLFQCPPWMKVYTREVDDPLQLQLPGKVGGINVIDLANINSCSFIATQDLGKCYENGLFEILGRYDHAMIRGCNLMVP